MVRSSSSRGPSRVTIGDLAADDDGVLADVGVGLPGSRVSGSGLVGDGRQSSCGTVYEPAPTASTEKGGSARGPAERPAAEHVQVGVEDALLGRRRRC